MSERAKVKSLWGDLPVEESIRTPHVILKEQASILTEATNGLLVGKVVRENFKATLLILPKHAISFETFKDLQKKQEKQKQYTGTSRLEILVPSINNYSISILDVDYPPKMYPLRIMSSITDEYQYKECQTESEFNEKLAKILSSPDVKRIIAGLLTGLKQKSCPNKA